MKLEEGPGYPLGTWDGLLSVWVTVLSLGTVSDVIIPLK